MSECEIMEGYSISDSSAEDVLNFNVVFSRFLNYIVRAWSFILIQTTQGGFLLSLVETFSNFVHKFSLFLYNFPLKRGEVLHLNKLEFPSPKDVLCQVWVKLTQWFWERRFLNIILLIFLPLAIRVVYFTNTCLWVISRTSSLVIVN